MTITEKRNTFKNVKMEEVKTKLKEIFGPENVSDSQSDLYPYSYDMTDVKPGMPDFVVIPENKEQLVELVKFCNEHIIPIVPYISGNNVGGIAIPLNGGIVVDFGKKMNKILHINDNMMYALLEPGVTFGQLKKYLDDNYPHLRYSYPFAPPYAGVVGNALLSGMNNMSGKIGSMGDSINGLEVITSDGDVARIGSCFYGKEEADPDQWYSRYPMPDLMGLFVNWQGMTGLVTKCAVQLWPRDPIEKIMVALFFDLPSVGKFMREVGRLDIANDLASVSIEVAKMAMEVSEPVRYPGEPAMLTYIPITGKTQKMVDAKLEILQNKVKELKDEGMPLILEDLHELAQLINLRLRCYVDLPAVILSLVEYSGLTWFGSYAPTHVHDELIPKVDAIFHKYGVPPFIYMKNMKTNHYGIFRPIIRYNKYEEGEEEKIHDLLEEITDVCIDAGCIPYKTPNWMTEKMRKKINPGWLNLFEKVKKTMDPNNIFNPGRWNI